MKKILSMLCLVVLVFGAFLGTGFSAKAETEVPAKFSLGKEYENGGVDTTAKHAVNENWSFNSLFEGAKTNTLHATVESFKKGNVYDVLLDSDGSVYTVESAAFVKTTIVAYDKSGAVRWSFSPSNGAKALTLGKDHTLYFRESSYVTAVDTRNGALKWRSELTVGTPSAATNSYITVDKEGTVYTTGLKEVYAIDGNGTSKWVKSFPKNIATPVKVDKEGRLFFATLGSLISLDKNGEVLWDQLAGGIETSSNLEFLANNQLLLTMKKYDGYVISVADRSTGELLKKVSLNSKPNGVTVSDLDGSVYVVGNDLTVFDKDFQVKWKIEKAVNKVLLDKNSKAYTYVSNGNIFAYDTAGNEIWNYAVNTGDSHVWTSNIALNEDGQVLVGLRTTKETTNTYSYVTIGDTVLKACDRMSKVLEDTYNPKAPDYAFKSTPFYDFDVCNRTVTFQFDGSDPAILAEKDKHREDVVAFLSGTGSFVDGLKFVWKDVKNNNILLEDFGKKFTK